MNIPTQFDEARMTLAKFNRNVDIAERIHAKLPEDIQEKTAMSCSFEWLQLCNLDREQTERAMRALAAGEWDRKPSRDPAMLDYETHIDGLRVLIYAAPPPGTCRVIEETVVVPAKTITRRTLVCK